MTSWTRDGQTLRKGDECSVEDTIGEVHNKQTESKEDQIVTHKTVQTEAAAKLVKDFRGEGNMPCAYDLYKLGFIELLS